MAALPGAPLDGALVVDKPAGMTSHDVVAAVRRAFGGARVGHTGTLDPLATGVLPLLVGRATRLAQFLAHARKAYEAHVRFGWATTTYDATGEAVGERATVALDRLQLDALLHRFRGAFEQAPPAFSAKKVDGRRAYVLARADRAPGLAPVRVTVDSLEVVAVDGDTAVLRVACSAGFYVRSLAHDLGTALGTGAHLAALRRIASGPFTIADALPLERVLQEPGTAAGRLVAMADLLPDLPLVRLAASDVERVRRGQDVATAPDAAARSWTRLVTPEGVLAAVARPSASPGLLHPVVVVM